MGNHLRATQACKRAAASIGTSSTIFWVTSPVTSLVTLLATWMATFWLADCDSHELYEGQPAQSSDALSSWKEPRTSVISAVRRVPP